MKKKTFLKDPKLIRHAEQIMEKFPFVRWDRFTKMTYNGMQGTGIAVYGWIDREKDAYKDFIILYLYDDGDATYDTSSAKYSAKIHEMLHGGTNQKHMNCKRVEKFFKIKNSIKL